MRQSTLRNNFFFLLLALTTLVFFGLIRDFWQPLFWAAVLATLFYPTRKRLERALSGYSILASVLTLLLILLVVIAPLFLIGLAVSREATGLYERISSGEIDLQALVQRVENFLPRATNYLEQQFGIELDQLRENLSGAAVTASQFVASRAVAIGQDALRFSVLFFLMLYVLFFFLRDGEDFVDALIRALPLGDERERRLFAKFAQVARATIKGTLVVAFIQGALGGLLFWILGIAAPVFWGVIMTVLSLLPAIGSALIWGPAAIILLATGEIVKGLVLIAAGTVLIGLVDNLLRPLLVGRETQMPDFLILLATLGGLAVYGLSGFVIGPIVAAFFLVVWEMFAEDYAEDQNAEDVRSVKKAATRPEVSEEAAQPAHRGGSAGREAVPIEEGVSK